MSSAEIEALRAEMETMKRSADSVWLMRSSFSILAMQIGFAALESGFVRSKSIVNISMKNVADLAFGALSFFLCGWAFAWGDTAGGFIGTTGFAMSGVPESLMSFALFHFSFSATAVTIVSGAVAERIKIRAYMLICILMPALIYPVVVHWEWHADGWLAKEGFVDLAGDGAVHMVGGFAGLVGAWILGPRQGRFPNKRSGRAGRHNQVESLYSARQTHGAPRTQAQAYAQAHATHAGLEDEDDEPNAAVLAAAAAGGIDGSGGSDNHSLTNPSAAFASNQCEESAVPPAQQLAPMSSPAYAVLGLFMLMVGWYSFNASSVGSVRGEAADKSAKVTLTTTFACAAGTITAIVLSFIFDRHFIDVRRCINCTLAALVAITGPCHVVTLWSSFAVGILGALTASASEIAVNALRIDDPLSAFSVHGAGGVAGILLAGLFHETEGLFFGGGWRLLGVQLMGAAAIAGFTTAASLVLFLAIDKTYGMRMTAKEELLGADSTEHNIVRYVDASSPLLLKGIRSLLDHDPDLREVRHRFMRRSRSFVVLPRAAPSRGQGSNNAPFAASRAESTLPGSVHEDMRVLPAKLQSPKQGDREAPGKPRSGSGTPRYQRPSRLSSTDEGHQVVDDMIREFDDDIV